MTFLIAPNMPQLGDTTKLTTTPEVVGKVATSMISDASSSGTKETELNPAEGVTDNEVVSSNETRDFQPTQNATITDRTAIESVGDDDDDDAKKRRRRSSLLRRSLSSSSVMRSTKVAGGRAPLLSSQVLAAAALEDKKKKTRNFSIVADDIALMEFVDFDELDENDSSDDEAKKADVDKSTIRANSSTKWQMSELSNTSSAAIKHDENGKQLVQQTSVRTASQATTSDKVDADQEVSPVVSRRRIHPLGLQKRSGSFTSRRSRTIHTVVNPLDVTLKIVQREDDAVNVYELLPNHTGNNRVAVMIDLQLDSFLKFFEQEKELQLDVLLDGSASVASSTETSSQQASNGRTSRATNRVFHEVVKTVEEYWEGRFLVQVEESGEIGYTLLSRTESIHAVRDLFHEAAAAEELRKNALLTDASSRSLGEASDAASTEAETVSSRGRPRGRSESSLSATTTAGDDNMSLASSIMSNIEPVPLHISPSSSVNSSGARRLVPNSGIDLAASTTIGSTVQDVHKSALDSLRRRKQRQYATSKISNLVSGRGIINNDRQVLKQSQLLQKTQQQLSQSKISNGISSATNTSQQFLQPTNHIGLNQIVNEEGYQTQQPLTPAQQFQRQQLLRQQRHNTLNMSVESLPAGTAKLDDSSDTSYSSLPATFFQQKPNANVGPRSLSAPIEVLKAGLESNMQFLGSSADSLQQSSTQINPDIAVELQNIQTNRDSVSLRRQSRVGSMTLHKVAEYHTEGEGDETVLGPESRGKPQDNTVRRTINPMPFRRSSNSTVNTGSTDLLSSIADVVNDDDLEPYQTDQPHEISAALQQFQELFASNLVAPSQQLSQPQFGMQQAFPQNNLTMERSKSAPLIGGNNVTLETVGNSMIDDRGVGLNNIQSVTMLQATHLANYESGANGMIQNQFQSGELSYNSDALNNGLLQAADKNVIDLTGNPGENAYLACAPRRPSVRFQEVQEHQSAYPNDRGQRKSMIASGRRSTRLSQFSQSMIQELLMQLHESGELDYDEEDDL